MEKAHKTKACKNVSILTENEPPQHVIDVCGDVLGGESIARESGHITTPDYPAQYPPDESCMCSLKALRAKVRHATGLRNTH